MKICMVGVEIEPSSEGGFIGGSVNNVVRLSKGLHDKGHQIFLVTTPARFSRNTPFDIPWAEVQRIPIRGPYPSLGYGSEFVFKAIREIRRLNRSERISLVHSHSGLPAIGVIPTLTRKLYGMHSIHSLYCPIQDRSKTGYEAVFTQSGFVIRNCFLNVNRILALSTNIKNSLQTKGISQKIEVIPPIIDTTEFNPKVSGEMVRTDLKLNPENKLIVFVGNLTRTKGIQVLIQAMKQIVHEFPKTKLLVMLHFPSRILDIETRLIRRKITDLGLSKNVLFMGITKNMPNVLAACNLLVAPFLSTIGPSDYPMPVLEAMATGKPVIASKVGGIPEIIINKESGLLVNPNNPTQLANSIKIVLQNEDLGNEFGRTASKFVSGNFSVSEIVKKTERIYEEVLKM